MGWAASTRSQTIEMIVRECRREMDESADTDTSSVECGDVTVTVHQHGNGYLTVDLEPELILGGSIDEANARSVGPARWVRSAGTGLMKVRLDVPPGISAAALRRCVANALSRAGWRGRVANADAAAQRFRRDRSKVFRSLEQLGVDPAALPRMGGGMLVGYVGGLVGWQLTESVGGDSYSNDTYCHLSLVEDDERSVWLRVAGVIGSAEHGEVHEMSGEDGLFSVRHVFADLDRRDERRRRPVLAVADLALADVTPQRLRELVWSVVTYIEWQAGSSWGHGRDAVDGLIGEPDPASSEPLQLLDWTVPPPMLVPLMHGAARDRYEGDLERADRLLHEGFFDGDPVEDDTMDDFDLDDLREMFDQIDEHRYDGWVEGGEDEPPSEDSTDGSGATGTLHGGQPCRFGGSGSGLCSKCDEAMRRRGSVLIDRMAEVGVLSDLQRRELSSNVGQFAEAGRERQTAARLDVITSRFAPRIDFTSLDVDELKADLAVRTGRDNPAFDAGLRIIEMLVVEGRNDPVLLVGPAGLGKTMVAQAVAEVIGIRSQLVQLGSAAGRFVISGSDLEFRNAHCGAIATGLSQFGTPQFMVVFDEIEKLAGIAGDDLPDSAVLSLFDDQRSTYTDRFVGTEAAWQIDATDTVFIGTANEFARVSEPVRSRMDVVAMSAWTDEQKLALARRRMGEVAAELGIDQPFSDDELAAIVHGCPQAGVRELLRVLERCRSHLRRSGGSDRFDPLSLFEQVPATTVFRRLPVAAPAVGVVRSALMTPHGWQEIRCSATPNGSRWAGTVDVLGGDRDAFELHWVPAIEALLGVSVPPCTLHVEPVLNGSFKPAGLSIAMLAAVASAATGEAPRNDVVAPVRASPGGALEDVGFSAADLAGLSRLAFEQVVMAGEPAFGTVDARRTDLPMLSAATSLSAAIEAIIPAAFERVDVRDPQSTSGYL